MKRKILTTLMILLGIVVLVACTPKETLTPTFSGEPTVTQHSDPGKLDINALSEHDEGRIFYAIYESSVTSKTALEVVEGASSEAKGSSATKTLDVTVTLEEGTEYAVFLVVAHDDVYSAVKRVVQTTKSSEVVTLGFASLALASGAEDGEILLNAQSNGIGTIYYVLVEEGKAAPTAQQIKAGANYGDVVVIKSGNGAALSNVVLTGLVPQSRYTAYFVVESEGTFSTVRNMSAAAKLNVEQVDKGEGTEENPFKISTIQDLEQIGQGYYEVDGKEWTMIHHYALINDIDLTEKYGVDKESWGILGADALGARFEGTLDGQGYSIIGLYIDRDSSNAAYKGLFASSEATAVVKNLVFESPYVHASGINESDSNHGAGIIFGYLKGSVDHVEIIDGIVEDTLGGTRVGAIAGRVYVTGSVTNTYINAKVSGFNRVGGAVGVVDTSNVGTAPIVFKNIIFDGSVIGEDQHIGGLVGYARALDVSNVFITGYIQGSRDTGGVLGFYQKRGDNNNVIASIKDVIVHATVYGTGENANVGSVVGNKSSSGIDGFEHLLLVGDVYQLEDSFVHGGGGASAINGTEITLADLKSKTWFETNIPTWNFETDFELGAEHERPVLIGTSDLGLINELEVPLVTIVTVVPGVDERQLRVSINTNQAGSTIYYVVVASETTFNAEDLLEPEGVLFHSSGSSINATHLMSGYDTTYYVYYVVQFEDETLSEVFSASGNSKAMDPLEITGGIRPGNENKEIIVNLETSLPATIYYIIVDAEGEFSPEQIKAGTGALFSGTGSSIDNVSHIMAEEDATYYIYVYAETESKDRNGTYQGSGQSNSADIINYGEGTLANPFIIRTVADLEALGKGIYAVTEEQNLDYTLEAHYVLANDIDLTEKYGEGKLSWTPIGEFKGSIDGAGHTILGLYIHEELAGGLLGFITRVNGGTVKNILFDEVHVFSGLETADGNAHVVGGLAARSSSGIFENIQMTNVYIESNGFRVGALVGASDGSSSFKNIYVVANVHALGRVGGLIGNLSNDAETPVPVENVVAITNVVVTKGNTGNGRAGGLIGWARGVGIRNVYVEGVITGNAGSSNMHTGGIVGYIETQSATNLNAEINNALVNVVVVGHTSATNVVYGGAGGSGKAPSVENIFHADASELIFDGTPSGSSYGGEVLPENTDSAWFTTNLPGMSVENGWTFSEALDRPALDGTPDDGLFGTLEVPLMTFATASAGAEEKELKVEISTNQLGSTIYYVIVAKETVFTAAELLTPSDVLFSGHGDAINATHLMALFDTEYYVYYVVQFADETLSEVFETTGKSKEMTALTITGGLRPGSLNKELIIKLETNLPATIYYIIVDAQGEFTNEEIKNPTDVLFSGNGAAILDVIHLMPLADTEYYFYAFAETLDEREGLANGMGKSGSSEVINYGSGTEADPFIIRTINDLEAISNGLYDGNGEALDYKNNAHYVLANDLDLTSMYGAGLKVWSSIGEFKGTIDGAGFTITGLYIEGSGLGRFGFVKYLNNGVIKNLTFENATVTITDAESITSHNDNSVGVLAGHVGNSSIVENIRILNAEVTANRERVGGLIGSSTDHQTNANNIFNNIYVEANVTATGRVGGLFGALGGSQSQTTMKVSNIVFIGEVTSTIDNRVGGVVGWTQHSSIINVYVEAVVHGQGSGNQAGGLAGYVQDGATSVVISNALVHVAVIHDGSNNVGTIVGSKQGASNPEVTNVYQTTTSTLDFVGGSPSGNAFHGVELPLEADAAWFNTNLPGMSVDNGWEFKVDALRYTLVNTPDLGMFGDLE